MVLDFVLLQRLLCVVLKIHNCESAGHGLNLKQFILPIWAGRWNGNPGKLGEGKLCQPDSHICSVSGKNKFLSITSTREKRGPNEHGGHAQLYDMPPNFKGQLYKMICYVSNTYCD